MSAPGSPEPVTHSVREPEHDRLERPLGRERYFARRALLVVLVSSITLVMQWWVGTNTVYANSNAPRREALHRYILENRVPPGIDWHDIGANGTNVRIGAVYLAESLHEALNISLTRAYFLIDCIALAASLLLLFVYLAYWFSASYAIIGLLYFASILPLTYVLHYFHPWDRLGLLLWISLLLLLRARRTGWFAVLLVLSVFVKFDTVVLPGLYWLLFVTRRSWRRVTAVTAALLACSIGTVVSLRLLRPGGFYAFDRMALVVDNIETFREGWITYPPALAFAAPLLLSAIGYRSSNRFLRVSTLFALALILIFFADSHFIEVRAEMPVLLLLLPGALYGLQVLLGERGVPGTELA